MVKSMLRKDGQALARLGAVPSVNADNDSFRVADGFEKQYADMVKRYTAKTSATISDAPLQSTDASTYYGSYIVPVDTMAEIMRIATDASAMMGIVTKMPVRGITTYVPTTTDAFAFTKLTNQTTAKTEDTLTLGRATLTVCTYAFWIAITEEMDEDSLVALGAFIRNMGAEAWALKYDQLCLSDSTYGAIKTTGVKQVTMAKGGTAFGGITVDYCNDLVKQLDTRAKRRGARFFMHPTVWDYLVDAKDDNGNYILRQPADSAPLALRGYPVVLTDGMPDSGDSAISTDFVGFGNPAYIINGDKTGFEFRIFDQTMGTMQYDQIYLRCRVRQAFVNAIPTAWAKLTTAAS
jgi:HK97 family phage major capsid protein